MWAIKKLLAERKQQKAEKRQMKEAMKQEEETRKQKEEVMWRQRMVRYKFDYVGNERIKKSVSALNTEIRFDDIVGLEKAKEALRENVVWPRQHPELFRMAKPLKSILFYGPTGCGKSLLANALANESNYSLLSVIASNWLESSEKLVETLFYAACNRAPSILFIDQIDVLLSKRKENEPEATRKFKAEFFSALNDLRSSKEKVFVMATSNSPFTLNEDVLHCFSKHIFIGLPDPHTRKELLKKLLKGQKKSPDEVLIDGSELDELVELTDGYTASDITRLTNDAALRPIRELCGNKMKVERNLRSDELRNINLADFKASLITIKSSCATKDVDQLIKWNQEQLDASDLLM